MPDPANDLLLQVLRKEEGLRLDPYKDSLGFWTIGYGHLIDRRKGGELPSWIAPSFPIAAEEAEELLYYDAREISMGFTLHLLWWPRLDAVRRVVLLAMAFQMGEGGVLNFTHTLRAIQDKRWNDAGAAMLDSKWAGQTPERAARMAKAMVTGDAAAFELA